MSLALLVGVSGSVFAQKKGFDYKFYGQVRTDLFYNTRSNSETVDGLFYMYPLDENLDPNGHDLNGVGNGNFYTLYTRLGVDVTGPMLGKAKTSAKVELISVVRVLLIRCSVFVMSTLIWIGANQRCW